MVIVASDQVGETFLLITNNIIKPHMYYRIIYNNQVWDEPTLRRNVGAVVILHKNEDGSFDEDAAVSELTEKYGLEEQKRAAISEVVASEEGEKDGSKR